MNDTPPRADTTARWHGSKVLDSTTAARWLEALDAYAADRANIDTPALLRKRLTHTRRFAIAAKVSPWHVTPQVVESWYQSFENLAPSTRNVMRSSLRAFYRWASTSGRIAEDPTAPLYYSATRLAVPEPWSEPLAAFERYMWAQGLQPGTVRTWGEILRKFARDHRYRTPWEISVDDLYEWMASNRWARETRRSRKSVVRNFYGWAVETGRIDRDPSLRMPKVRAGDPVARPATEDEYATALARATDPRWRLALRLAAEMGLRRAEVSRIHSSDLRRDTVGELTLTVRGKGDKVRVLPVPSALQADLLSLDPGYAFPGRIVERQAHRTTDGHLSPRYMGKRIAELMPPGVTMHTLRHRFATRAYGISQDVMGVQRLLGHASPATTQRYVRISDEKLRQLMESVSSS